VRKIFPQRFRGLTKIWQKSAQNFSHLAEKIGRTNFKKLSNFAELRRGPNFGTEIAEESARLETLFPVSSLLF
jgi:hypothetical protein